MIICAAADLCNNYVITIIIIIIIIIIMAEIKQSSVGDNRGC